MPPAAVRSPDTDMIGSERSAAGDGARRDAGRRRGRGGRHGRRAAALAAVLVALVVASAVAPAVGAAGTDAAVRSAVGAGGTASTGVGASAGPDGGGPLAADRRRVVGDTLNASATPVRIAAGVGDRVAVTGETVAGVDEVRLYLIGPRGTFLDADGDARAMETASAGDGSFAVDYEAFERRGEYSLLVVSPRADGAFETTETLGRDALPSDATHDQAVDRVRAAYGRDEVVELTIRGASPSIGIDPVSADGTLPRAEDVAVSGPSNRGVGATVAVELVAGSGRTVTSVETTVNATNATWRATLDTTGVDPGSYTLFVDDGAATAAATVVVINESEVDAAEATPAETPVPDEDADDADDAQDTVDDVTGAALENATSGLDAASDAVANATGEGGSGGDASGSATNGTATGTTDAANGTTNGTAGGTATGTTSEQTPGFGVGAAAAALAVALAAAALTRRPRT